MSSPDQAKAGQSLPRLSVVQEQALVGEAQAGSERAVAALIKAFTPLLAAQARKVRSTWLDADAREQAAVVGLLEAIYRFDPKRGTRLATLAAWWMRWELEQVAARAQPLPLPEKEHRLRHKVQAVALRLYAERGERASAQDVALAAGMAVGYVRSRLAATRIMVSLDHPDVEQLVADETCNQQDIDVERDTVQRTRHELAAVAQRLSTEPAGCHRRRTSATSCGCRNVPSKPRCAETESR